MIKSLAPLGGTHTIHLILDYSEADVNITAILKPKKEGQGKAHTLSIAGPIGEVNEKLGVTLAEAVGKITEFNHNLANIVADIQAAEAEKKKTLEAAKTAAKPKAADKTDPKAITPAKTPAVEPAKPPIVERTLARPAPPAPAKAPVTPPAPPPTTPAATPAVATVAGVDKPVALVPATTVVKPPSQETISLGGAEDLGL